MLKAMAKYGFKSKFYDHKNLNLKFYFYVTYFHYRLEGIIASIYIRNNLM